MDGTQSSARLAAVLRWVQLAVGAALTAYALLLFASPRAPSPEQVPRAAVMLRRDHTVEAWLAATGLLWIWLAVHGTRRRIRSRLLPVVSLAGLALYVALWR